MYHALVVGVGAMGTHHAKVLSMNGLASVTVKDIDKGREAILEQESPSIGFSNSDRKKIDFVVVATPTPTHFDVARKYLEMKIPVLLEKPMCDNFLSASALCDIADDNETLLYVGNVERFNPAVRHVKYIVQCLPNALIANRIVNTPPERRQDDVVLDLNYHDIDLFRCLFPGIEFEPEMLSTTPTGALCSFKVGDKTFVSVSAYREIDQQRNLTMAFDGGENVSLDFSKGTVTKTNDIRFHHIDGTINTTTTYVLPEINKLRRQAEDFIKCLNRNFDPVTSGRDALETMRLIESLKSKKI